MEFEVLMNSKMLAEDSLDIRFIPSVEITSTQLVLLSSANRFYMLGWGGIVSTGQSISDSISTFAYTPDGYLLMVSRNNLCYIDSMGKLWFRAANQAFSSGSPALFQAARPPPSEWTCA